MAERKSFFTLLSIDLLFIGIYVLYIILSIHWAIIQLELYLSFC